MIRYQLKWWQVILMILFPYAIAAYLTVLGLDMLFSLSAKRIKYKEERAKYQRDFEYYPEGYFYISTTVERNYCVGYLTAIYLLLYMLSKNSSFPKESVSVVLVPIFIFAYLITTLSSAKKLRLLRIGKKYYKETKKAAYLKGKIAENELEKQELKSKENALNEELEKLYAEHTSNSENIANQTNTGNCAATPKENQLPKVLTHEELVNNEMLTIDLMSSNGWEFEEYSASLLKYNGFKEATVTSKSNDFGVDVIATTYDGVRYAVQCKCYSDKLNNKPVQEIVAGMKVYDCHVGLVLTNSYFTDNAKALARKNGILLWDRDKLKKMVSSKLMFEQKGIIEQPDEIDDMFLECLEYVIQMRKFSISELQQHFKLGYSRIARIVDKMEERGFVSSANENQSRRVLITYEQYKEMTI